MTVAPMPIAHNLDPHAHINTLINTALAGLATTTARVYRARIASFIRYLEQERTSAQTAQSTNGTGTITRESVKSYLSMLEHNGASAQVLNQTLAAIKKLTSEASEIGRLDGTIAIPIAHIKAKHITGVRTGRWLDLCQTAQLLASPDSGTIIGRRDRAVLALLIGTGIRRAEACALNIKQVRTTENQLLLVNVRGKVNRLRSIAVPKWAAQVINEWMKEIKE